MEIEQVQWAKAQCLVADKAFARGLTIQVTRIVDAEPAAVSAEDMEGGGGIAIGFTPPV